jgi:DNA helicase II / ATP-dependent DNA helicase PcrA
VTSRIGSPDTAADLDLRACLDQSPTRSFIMVAGAGSGKTTSLVKALAHLECSKGAAMRRRGQQIACITFTKVAVGEIWGDVGNAPLFHVSTIHSFLWSIVHSFQEDLRDWVAGRIAEKIAESEEKIDKPRTHEPTRVRLRADIIRYNNQLAQLPHLPRFTYTTGSNYGQGKLGDDDILRVGPALIEQHALMRSIVAQRFPFIFVDESQDTNPDVVAALKRIAATPGASFCLGFFGDPMQKIYMAGAGAIGAEAGWTEISKPENFRCPASVLNVINRIRAEDDRLRLIQVAGNRIGPDGPVPTPVGTAKLFIIQAGPDRTARINQVRQWMATANNDPLWQSDEEDGNVRMLVLVHRIAASRLGFPDLYASLHDNGAAALKDGLQEGTAWVLRPFILYILPLVLAAREGSDFDVMSTLRRDCPLLEKERIGGQDVATLLEQLQKDIDSLVEMFSDGSLRTIKDVLDFVHEQELADLDPRFIPYLTGTAANAPDEEDSEYQSVLAFLFTPATQLWGYNRYIQSLSPFETQQGVKGAEFRRVLVVLDDEESDYNLFSYAKYWGIEPLSQGDRKNIAEGKDSVLDRTRRLFYVCCSRAVQDLAVVFFVPNVQLARQTVLAKALFAPEAIHIFDGPLP